MAHEFALKTVAEFVEDEATAEMLAALGVDYAQGYFYGRPALPE
jgi:EAL domain-containing protein (putative c-di-GMP-specific phosphodiesterase class I)